MQYKPGSKYKIQNTNGKELAYKVNKYREYKGFYLEMSDGTYFAGKSIQSIGAELVSIIKKTPGSVLETTSGNRVFSVLKKSHYNFLDKTKSIIATKNFPTEHDYKKGKFLRYFAKRKNTQYGYLEINKKTYDSLKNKKPEYDWHLYSCGELIWGLQGEISSINNISIKRTERMFKGVSILFPNLEEFYLPPIIQEEKEFRETQESHPESDKKAQAPKLQKAQNKMMSKVKEDYDKKQRKLATKLKNLKKEEAINMDKQYKDNQKFIGGGTTSGGGMSSGGGGTSGGGGGGY